MEFLNILIRNCLVTIYNTVLPCNRLQKEQHLFSDGYKIR